MCVLWRDPITRQERSLMDRLDAGMDKLDVGGAKVWKPPPSDFGAELNRRSVEMHKRMQPNPTVTVRTSETHDGAGCDCIDEELTLSVGETIELTHTCHDGRVDKVIATVLSIDVPPPVVEHGAVTKR